MEFMNEISKAFGVIAGLQIVQMVTLLYIAICLSDLSSKLPNIRSRKEK